MSVLDEAARLNAAGRRREAVAIVEQAAERGDAEALFALAQVYTMRAAERDETSALAMLQLAAAMRRRASLMGRG